ncbi:MAG: hypothetical protein JW908_08435 [Anaerolineales bacterium]|nr:hypothetical protein [Anaerolineales bacterium]
MTVKTWRPNSISTKPINAFVDVDTASEDEQDVQIAAPLEEQNWSVAQFPAVVSENQESNDAAGEMSLIDERLQGWQPSEIEATFVVNRDISSRFTSKDGSNAGHSQHFANLARKSEIIIDQANSMAEEIVSKAEKQASEIIQQAESQATQLTHQAYQDGLAAANAEISDLLKTARAIAEEVDAWRENTLAKGEMMMLRLVIEIAQSLFGEGLPLDPDTLGNAFSRALAQAKTLGDLRIYVHPEDAVALTPHWAQQQETFSGQKIELIPSEIIKRGGCFIEGQYGNVDARIETQLKMTKDTLLEAFTMPPGSQE